MKQFFSYVYALLMAFDEIALNPLFLSAFDVISLPIILCVYPRCLCVIKRKKIDDTSEHKTDNNYT